MPHDRQRRESEESIESINCCQLNVHKQQILRKRADHYQHPIKSPLSKRSCTDVICLLIFIVFLCAWAVVGYFAFKNGNPGEIFAPLDSQNKRCGYDDDVKDKPHLFFFDLSKCVPNAKFRCDTPQVCVSSCPSQNFYYEYYYQNPNIDMKFIFPRLICQASANITSMSNKEEVRNAINNNQCSPWYLDSTPVANRCLPKELSTLLDGIVSIKLPTPDGNTDETSLDGVSGEVIKKSSELIKALSAVNEFAHAVVKDLSETWPYIIACFGIAVIASFLFIVIMRWIAGIMVWFSLIACIGLLSYCSYITWIRYEELRDQVEPPSKAKSFGDPIFDALESQWERYLEMKDTWLAFFIIAVSVLAIILLIVVFLRSRIRLAISLINEGSKAVASSWSTLVFPIFPWIIQALVLAYSVATCLYLFSSGAPIYRVSGLSNDDCTCKPALEDGDLCAPELFSHFCHNSASQTCATAGCFLSKDEAKKYDIYLQLYNLFMFLWGLFFVSGFGQMVLASTFATYYWTFRKRDIPFFTVATSALRVLRYHLGTVAFGSFLLALVNWIRVVIELAYKYVNKYDNAFVKAVKCCLSCFFWCLDKFLRFLNKNAYIMCAIHGKNFCLSAKDAFSLLLRNVLRVFVLDKVTDFLFFIIKLTITAGMGALSFYFFSKPVPDLNDDFVPYQARYYFVPIIFVCIGTYFISSLFFSVYSMAVDTLFLCFLEDCEINDGSPAKPYFMSKNLMKILGKKNKE